MTDPELHRRYGQDPPSDEEMSELALALHTETRLLHELAVALRRQREGVSADDLTMVDDSVFAANRIMRTLGEASRLRRNVITRIWRDELPIQEWEPAFGNAMTIDLRDAVERVQAAADVLSREIEINRVVLQTALSAGEGLIRAAAGAPAQADTYGTRGTAPPTKAGILFNRKV